MDSSFRDQESTAQKDPKRFFVSLTFLLNIVQRLVGFVNITEEEQEDAGIYIDHWGNE